MLKAKEITIFLPSEGEKEIFKKTKVEFNIGSTIGITILPYAKLDLIEIQTDSSAVLYKWSNL